MYFLLAWKGSSEFWSGRCSCLKNEALQWRAHTYLHLTTLVVLKATLQISCHHQQQSAFCSWLWNESFITYTECTCQLYSTHIYFYIQGITWFKQVHLWKHLILQMFGATFITAAQIEKGFVVWFKTSFPVWFNLHF